MTHGRLLVACLSESVFVVSPPSRSGLGKDVSPTGERLVACRRESFIILAR
jgi:hypothetical protein